MKVHKVKSIIMNADEIVAVHTECKTQFRRTVKPQPYWQEMGYSGRGWYWQELKIPDEALSENPYGQLGDKLYVRETFSESLWIATSIILYKADYPKGYICEITQQPAKWKSPVRMSKWMSRITIEITNVRIEQLQDITIEDVLSEGIEAPDWLSNIDSWHDPDDVMIEIYAEYWNAHFKPDWTNNPEVWVIDFKEVK